MRKRFRDYTPEYKLKIIQYAIDHSRTAVSRISNIARETVNNWCRQRCKIGSEVYARKWRNHRQTDTPTSSSSDVDYTVYIWFLHRSLMGARITSHDVRREAQICRNQLGQSDFDVGNEWLQKWCERYKIDITEDQLNPAELIPPTVQNEDKLSEINQFHHQIRTVQSINDYQINQVGIICETCVQLRVTSSEIIDLTLILSSLADGTKYPPLVVLMGDNLPKSVKIIPDLHIAVSDYPRAGESEILWWLKNIWPVDKYQKRRLLISSLSHQPTFDRLQSLATRHCATDAIECPKNCQTDFLSPIFKSSLQKMTKDDSGLELIRNAWWDGVEINDIIEGFKRNDIVDVGDVYDKTRNDFLGFTQHDIDEAKKTARKVYVDLYDEIKNSGIKF